MGWTYKKAGVDLEKVRKAHKRITRILKATYRLRRKKFGEVVLGVGHYASLLDIGGGRALALHADGVGSKVMIAQLMDKYDTVGIDCVAMNVNDLICMGAEPVAMVDYLVVEKSDDRMIADIMRGLSKGAKEAKVAILGGETAVMPDVVKGAVEGKGFDLAALSIGVVDKSNVIDGRKLASNDVIIGLRSSGIHSNGLTLARKVIFGSGATVDDHFDGSDRTIGEELLTPTKIYVKSVRSVLAAADVHAVAHITGGAYTKLRRFEEYANVGFEFDSLPTPPTIFPFVQRLGKVADEEMYRTFNMGIGMCLFVAPEDVDIALRVCELKGDKAVVVGKVTRKRGIIIKTPSGRWIVP